MTGKGKVFGSVVYPLLLFLLTAGLILLFGGTGGDMSVPGPSVAENSLSPVSPSDAAVSGPSA